MKYMGSKRSMLKNGLGPLLVAESKSFKRFVDLFSGSASVSWYAARHLDLPVLTIDLQLFSAVIARAVIERVEAINSDELITSCNCKIKEQREQFSCWEAAKELDSSGFNTATWCKKAKELCNKEEFQQHLILNAYGGHYFSPTQALTFDAIIDSLPKEEPKQSVCLAAAIIAASKCVASPGHTAQPFKASHTAGPFLREAWKRDPLSYFNAALKDICPQHAKKKGKAKVADAIGEISNLRESDLVFIDPPYSGVHYSRFYHVLETIARGYCGPVSGTGRYPPLKERPASAFSRKSESLEALQTLLRELAKVGCKVVFTFPAGECSNGLSGDILLEIAKQYYDVDKKTINGRFSTLGGNNGHRDARQDSSELLLVSRPR